MVRFRLGSIPVEIHLSHVLISGLLAWTFAQPGHGDLWPDTVLRNPSSPDYAATQALTILVWAVVISGSVLIHELGHALASLLFGYRPSIHLIGMGGVTQPNAEGQIPWHRDVLLTLAGPVFGLMLGLASGAVFFLIDRAGGSEGARYILRGAAIANIFWAVLNMIPVQPLDGGRIATAVLQRVFGRQGFLYAQILALVLGSAVLVFSAVTRSIFLGIFFGMYMLRSWTLIQAYRRGELPVDAPSSPNEVALGRAETLFRDGKYNEARGLCEQLLAQDLQASQRARAHHVLGWVELKEGHGREALNHFGRVQNMSVAPQALAAAFSLVGDEDRAIPLWHMAASTSADPTLRHELAGALIRAGRVSDAKRLPDVRMSTAWTAAERVWSLRGELEKAAHAAESAFQAEPSAELAYDAACAWARAAQDTAAMRMLQLAAQNGFDQLDVALADPDLAPLRETPDFRAWLDGIKQSAPA
jgi:Zn-dependent protease